MKKYQETTVRFSPQARDAIGRLKQQTGHRSMAALLEYLVRQEAISRGCWTHRAVNLHSVGKDK